MQNVANPDRIVRIVLGALLALLPFITGWAVWTSVWATGAAVVVGLILVATAVFGFCPIYAALGLNFRRR